MADAVHSSQTTQGPSSISTDAATKRSREEADRVREMAAKLFAELFYRQVMANRKKTHGQTDADKKFDSQPPKGLQ